MKIERLSENQIRCTLNKADLNEKHLKISELAYGSQKARELFRDMIQQASAELGFEIDDTPLMVEAIPVSSDCLILIVTKVEDPEELDTRFSRFSKVNEYDIDDDDDFDDCDDVYDTDSDFDEEADDDSENNGNTVARIQINGSENVPEEIKRVLEGLLKNLSGLTAVSSDSASTSSDNSTTFRHYIHSTHLKPSYVRQSRSLHSTLARTACTRIRQTTGTICSYPTAATLLTNSQGYVVSLRNTVLWKT